MTIPPFNNDGIIPPFMGLDPGESSALMSPYAASPAEIVGQFGTDLARLGILHGWLLHRAAIRAAGLTDGFQWLDGSFVERKQPRDIDTVHFIRRSRGLQTAQVNTARAQHPSTFSRAMVKQQFKVDLFLVDLGSSESVVTSAIAFYLQLFCHQRTTFLWKGILSVEVDDVQADTDALGLLAERTADLKEAESS